MKYGFIGLGNMAGAILQGMHQSGRFGQDTLMGYDIDQGKMDALARSVGLQAMASEAAVAQACDVLVLAVKPQMADGVLDKLKDALDEKKLVITVLAGKPLAYYASRLTPGVPVIRVLPNLNALAGRSTTGLCVNEHVTQQQLALTTALFEAVGSVMTLPEAQATAFSALTGAAPAFVFAFIDALASAGVKAGFPRDTAQALAADMLMGSAALTQQIGQHPAQLIDRVCSPGGTTIEGMHALKALGFEHAVHAAVEAVMEKDRKLAQG